MNIHKIFFISSIGKLVKTHQNINTHIGDIKIPSKYMETCSRQSASEDKIKTRRRHYYVLIRVVNTWKTDIPNAIENGEQAETPFMMVVKFKGQHPFSLCYSNIYFIFSIGWKPHMSIKDIHS